MQNVRILFSKKLFRLLLLIFLISALAGTHRVLAETLTLKTYYPSPFGAYSRLRLVPMEELSGECKSGTLYSSKDDNALHYCVGQEEEEQGQWRLLQPIMVERGTLTVFNEDLYRVRFTKAFTKIPLIQAYLVIEDEELQGRENIIMGNFFTLSEISAEGFIVNHHGSEEIMHVLWVAIGD